MTDATPNKTLLKVDNISVTLGGTSIIHDASFTVNTGAFIGLIGPNGAGKTTLLRACLGLLPFKGRICYGASDILELSQNQRAQHVSYLPQNRTVHWDLKVADVVALGRLPQRISYRSLSDSDRLAIEKAMRQMSVFDLRDRLCLSLSGGELARVLIARCLAQDTPLLLVDEPTAGLDPAHQIVLMKCFCDLAEQGYTIISCMHDLSLAGKWCHRLLLLDNGNIFLDGPPASVLSHEHLAKVYGIKARILDDQDGYTVVQIDLKE